MQNHMNKTKLATIRIQNEQNTVKIALFLTVALKTFAIMVQQEYIFTLTMFVWFAKKCDGRGLGFESGISHNDPDVLQNYSIIM